MGEIFTTARARWLGVAAIAAQVAFVAAWAVAGALEPGYSPVDRQISALGAGDASHPWIVNGGIVILGAGFAFLAAGLASLGRVRANPLLIPLLAACAALTAAAGVLPLDCGASPCGTGDRSWQHEWHSVATTFVPPLLLATPFIVAIVEWPARWAGVALASGVAGVALWLLTLYGDDGPAGLYQRLGIGFIHYWVTALAATQLLGAGRYRLSRE